MALASCLAKYKCEMLCDFAEYYHIYKIEEHPVGYIAILLCGLPSKSRTVMAISGQNVETSEMLLAMAVDRLSLIWWSKTQDASKGRNRPKLIMESMNDKPSHNDIKGFDTVEEFERARAQILRKEEQNG